MRHPLTKSNFFTRCKVCTAVVVVVVIFLVAIFFAGCATQPYEGPVFKDLKTWDTYGQPMVGADTYIHIENCGVELCFKDYIHIENCGVVLCIKNYKRE